MLLEVTLLRVFQGLHLVNLLVGEHALPAWHLQFEVVAQLLG